MQDWHPAGHCSFATSHPGHRPGDVVEIDGLEQILWPEHCVQGSAGAAFHPDLNLDGIHEIVQKGTNPHIDSYSGFFDNARLRSTRLHHLLQARGVDHVTVTGLATDYCVKYTVLDALDLGYGTTVLADACRGVELRPGDVAEALREMRAAGAQVIHSS
jgi:nicotinamidase/pyrazinamidase